ncbi:MAG: DUF2139 domain-containing protein [Sulfolobales archaeon]
MVIEDLKQYRFRPQYSPEWGSGGIFGLRYHRGFLYFMLSFEARAYFISRDLYKEYDLNLVGPPPRSGGDTYNASDAIDNKIFFGGWAHAPIRFIPSDRRIDFSSKYSHLHYFDIDNLEVKIIWKESAGNRDTWVGEISNILYDPAEQRLLVSRADGSQNLGVYSVGLDGTSIRLSDRPSLKGALLGDQACFDISEGFEGFKGLQCLDLVDKKWIYRILGDRRKISVDGAGFEKAGVGVVAPLYGRILTFVRGGYIVWEPWEKEGEDLYFVRLFDLPPSDYGPLRTSYVPLGGGIVVPFNSYTHGMLRPKSEEERVFARSFNSPAAPTLLLYLTPPTIRILCPLGARVTSLESMGEKMILGVNTAPNTGGGDATPLDLGEKSLLIINVDSLLNTCRSSFVIKVRGSHVRQDRWGGIPLTSVKRALLNIYAGKGNMLRIYEYDASLPPSFLGVDSYRISSGKNSIDLSSYKNIVSMELEEVDEKANIYIALDLG